MTLKEYLNQYRESTFLEKSLRGQIADMEERLTSLKSCVPADAASNRRQRRGLRGHRGEDRRAEA